MYIAYFDESGDDGYPAYSSPLFVLSNLYLHFSEWKNTYSNIQLFRQALKTQFSFPIKMELHTKELLLNKDPYRFLNLSDADRLSIIDLFVRLIPNLDVKIINVVVNKTIIRLPNYPVLEKALTYSVQRIENDLRKIDPSHKFIMIVDEGRVRKMAKIARKIQKINFIPSKFNAVPYRREISKLIEDPLPKSSDQSHFIQICDLLASIVYLYKTLTLGTSKVPRRLPSQIDQTKLEDWLNILTPVLNLDASPDSFGILTCPK